MAILLPASLSSTASLASIVSGYTAPDVLAEPEFSCERLKQSASSLRNP